MQISEIPKSSKPSSSITLIPAAHLPSNWSHYPLNWLLAKMNKRKKSGTKRLRGTTRTRKNGEKTMGTFEDPSAQECKFNMSRLYYYEPSRKNRILLNFIFQLNQEVKSKRTTTTPKPLVLHPQRTAISLLSSSIWKRRILKP